MGFKLLRVLGLELRVWVLGDSGYPNRTYLDPATILIRALDLKKPASFKVNFWGKIGGKDKFKGGSSFGPKNAGLKATYSQTPRMVRFCFEVSRLVLSMIYFFLSRILGGG